MSFCQQMQLVRTRRILAERQAEIVRAAKKKHVYALHKKNRNMRFEPWQMALAVRVAEKLEKSA